MLFKHLNFFFMNLPFRIFFFLATPLILTDPTGLSLPSLRKPTELPFYQKSQNFGVRMRLTSHMVQFLYLTGGGNKSISQKVSSFRQFMANPSLKLRDMTKCLNLGLHTIEIFILSRVSGSIHISFECLQICAVLDRTAIVLILYFIKSSEMEEKSKIINNKAYKNQKKLGWR